MYPPRFIAVYKYPVLILQKFQSRSFAVLPGNTRRFCWHISHRLWLGKRRCLPHTDIVL